MGDEGKRMEKGERGRVIIKTQSGEETQPPGSAGHCQQEKQVEGSQSLQSSFLSGTTTSDSHPALTLRTHGVKLSGLLYQQIYQQRSWIE